jgi:hypothetical protein
MKEAEDGKRAQKNRTLNPRVGRKEGRKRRWKTGSSEL